MPKGQRQTEKAKSRIGEKHGLLIITDWIGSDSYRRALYKFKCACGETCENSFVQVQRAGQYASCGCSSNVGRALHHMKHGNSMRGAVSPEYQVWAAMLSRCNPNISRPDNKWYAGKGIRVCERWESFENFILDMGPRPKGKGKFEIDRIDSDKGYEPGNCHWITMLENRQKASALRVARTRAEKESRS